MKKKAVLTSLILGSIFSLFTGLRAQNVNHFTGGFSYSTPLLNVPSPFGPGESISASYGAGISVEQNASEIGLGWNINLGGAITRSVSGIPDDWANITVADPQGTGGSSGTNGFKTQSGTFFFKNDAGSDNMDFYRSLYKTDTTGFYFPNYDYYSISGPGIGGSLKPRLFDFGTTILNAQDLDGSGHPLPVIPYRADATYGFDKTMQFYFADDFNGDFKSRHYSTTPISGSTNLKLPGNTITDSELSSSAVPYIGVNNVGFNTTTNRLASAKYVEYTSDSDEILTFTVTDEAGFVYHYDLPVYMNSVTSGNYPLNNDYSIKVQDTTRYTDGNGNYYIQENTLTDNSPTYYSIPHLVEWKQNHKYAYKWLLTSVTGPDYEDSNSSGTVNAGDKGYWVTYTYERWAEHFTKRIPEYGFKYSFSPDDKTQDLSAENSAKLTGKFGTFTKYDQEIYYLNTIKTASHTAVMVRDVRNDEYSSQPYYYDNQMAYTSNMPSGAGTASKVSNYGTLYDDGGPTSNHSASCSSKVTITPPSATSITVKINYLNITDSTNDFVKILDPSNGDAVLASYSGILPVGPITFNKSSIKVQQFTNGTNNSAGFRLSWSSSIHPTVMPQLKLTRIILFKNEDFSTLNTPSSASYNVSTSIAGFDLTNTGKDLLYNETWYNHVNNKASIESKSLQTVEFDQDYSLARRYHNNIKTIVAATDKHSNPRQVQAGVTVPSADYAESGKLTLNEINTYGLEHVNTSPSEQFDYNASIATDNPNYNPLKVDYWSYYKSDASADGYSGYTNSTSKDSTDAWSLRKITSPLGGTTEITYESNQYGKVFDGEGGFRGPSKMYMIKSATTTDEGVNWTYTMEEGSNTITDFDSLKTYHPTGTHIYIPYWSDIVDTKFISSGTFTFGASSTVNSISDFYYTNSPFNINSPYFSTSPGSITESDFSYTGNGYIHFDLPIGIAQYGGGIRTKKITTKNGTTDTYVREYLYNEGVTPMEADRFSEEQLTVARYTNQGDAHYKKLQPIAYDPHKIGPGIGYTKVTERNLGQINTSNGSVQYTFNTNNAETNLTTVLKTGGITHDGSEPSCSALIDSTYIIEATDYQSGYWGQPMEILSSDMNGNITSKTVNEYSNLSQGAIVENYDFLNKKKYSAGTFGEPNMCFQLHHIICIKREKLVVLTKQTTYTPGASAVTECIAFDKITGSPIQTRITRPNKGINVTRKSPAFRISQYSAMGPKSVTSTNKNILEPIAYSRTTVDSTITNNSNFSDFSINTYKDDLNIRSFDVGSGKFISAVQNNLYWTFDENYAWAGANTSLDNYGLYKNSELPTPYFDYTLSSIDNKWRLGAENTLMDAYGHVLEVKGFNDRFSAKKYCFNDTLPIAEANNVNFTSFTFCGFESKVTDLDPGAGVVNFLEGEVKVNGGVKVSAYGLFSPHTGNGMIKVSASTTGPEYAIKYNSSSENSGLQKNRTYRGSVWVYSTSPSDCKLSLSFTGLSTQSISKSSATVTIGDWTLMNVEITVPASPANNDELKLYLEPGASGDAYFDDLRLQPVEATVGASIYDQRTNRLMATLDGNNFATIYKYDAGGRITEVWQEIEGIGLKRVKKYQYNYARGLN